MFVVAAGYYMITPVFLDIQSTPSAACQANQNCSDIFDRQYDIWFVLFEVLIGGGILSMYIRAVRRDSVESTVGDF